MPRVFRARDLTPAVREVVEGLIGQPLQDPGVFTIEVFRLASEDQDADT